MYGKGYEKMILNPWELVIVALGLVLIWTLAVSLVLALRVARQKYRHLELPLGMAAFGGVGFAVMYTALVLVTNNRNDAARFVGNIPCLIGLALVVTASVFLGTLVRQSVWDWASAKTDAATSKWLDEESKNAGQKKNPRKEIK